MIASSFISVSPQLAIKTNWKKLQQAYLIEPTRRIDYQDPSKEGTQGSDDESHTSQSTDSGKIGTKVGECYSDFHASCKIRFIEPARRIDYQDPSKEGTQGSDDESHTSQSTDSGKIGTKVGECYSDFHASCKIRFIKREPYILYAVTNKTASTPQLY